MGREGTYLDGSKTNWKSQWHPTLVTEPLAMFDHGYNLLANAAERWTTAPDNVTWTFNLRPGLQWSDGTPLTAQDYVFTVQRVANPETGFDTAWYFGAIKNLMDANAGKAKLGDIGVRAVNARTLEIVTEKPTPFLPMLLRDLYVVPEHVVTKVGDTWSLSPATAVSGGPFKLATWDREKQVVFEVNPAYRGIRRPYLERIVYKIGEDQAEFPAYLAGEIDAVPWNYEGVLSPSDLAKIQSDPKLKPQSHTWPYFMTWWIAFGGSDTAFKDPRVRKAFAMAIDKASLVKSALRGEGVPAFGLLPPGFHAAQPERLKTLMPYNPQQARKLLADAGYPGGKGFPSYALYLRAASPSIETVAEAIQAMLRQNLGIQVGIQNMDRKLFMDSLNKYKLPLVLVPWELDYYDASNFMDVYKSGGRHPWANAAYDKLVNQADSSMDANQRVALYRKAEEILVSEPGAVFLWNPTVTQLWKPWVKGHRR